MQKHTKQTAPNPTPEQLAKALLKPVNKRRQQPRERVPITA